MVRLAFLGIVFLQVPPGGSFWLCVAHANKSNYTQLYALLRLCVS